MAKENESKDQPRDDERRRRFVIDPREIVIWDADGNVIHNPALAKRWEEMDQAVRRGKEKPPPGPGRVK